MKYLDLYTCMPEIFPIRRKHYLINQSINHLRLFSNFSDSFKLSMICFILIYFNEKIISIQSIKKINITYCKNYDYLLALRYLHRNNCIQNQMTNVWKLKYIFLLAIYLACLTIWSRNPMWYVQWNDRGSKQQKQS